MSLEIKVNDEMKSAMKSGDKLRLNAIRSIRAKILEFKTSGSGKELNESEEVNLLNSIAKKLKDSISLYEQAGRTELAEGEKAELEVIMEFLPKQLSTEEIEVLVQKKINETNATSADGLKLVLGPIMKELKGKADGNEVQSIVKKLLGIG